SRLNSRTGSVEIMTCSVSPAFTLCRLQYPSIQGVRCEELSGRTRVSCQSEEPSCSFSRVMVFDLFLGIFGICGIVGMVAPIPSTALSFKNFLLGFSF